MYQLIRTQCCYSNFAYVCWYAVNFCRGHLQLNYSFAISWIFILTICVLWTEIRALHRSLHLAIIPNQRYKYNASKLNKKRLNVMKVTVVVTPTISSNEILLTISISRHATRCYYAMTNQTNFNLQELSSPFLNQNYFFLEI